MRQVTFKTIICLILMGALLILALATRSVINGTLYASLAIIMGAVTSHYMSNNNSVTKSKKIKPSNAKLLHDEQRFFNEYFSAKNHSMN